MQMINYTDEEILEKTRTAIAGSLSLSKDQVGPHTSLDELGADSLDLVEIACRLEQEFGEVPDGQSFIDIAEKLMEREGSPVADTKALNTVDVWVRAVRQMLVEMPDAVAGGESTPLPRQAL